jgi:serine/threonine protein kinase
MTHTISHYRILEKLGAGGMGEVFLAEDTKLQRRVAIKFIQPDAPGSDQAHRRLLREARAAARLDHPNICAIHEVGEEGGSGFIVMQYLEGETLDHCITRHSLTLPQALGIAVDVAGALSEAHAHGIIHRDIKTSNVIVTPRGQAVVMDFGLASIGDGATDSETQSRLTTPHTVPGTVPYMSPEQLTGAQADARSDIFSFGVMLYETFSGQRPFAGETAAAIAAAILTQEPQPLTRHRSDVPDELQRIVRKCLEKDRDRRYQSAADLRIDLDKPQTGGRLAPASARAPWKSRGSSRLDAHTCAGRSGTGNSGRDRRVVRAAPAPHARRHDRLDCRVPLCELQRRSEHRIPV